MSATPRILLAKVGLDGHDRGVKIVARILRDAGFEVVYIGLFNDAAGVAAAARDEDVDVVGISMLSGAHLTLAPAVAQAMQALQLDIPLVVGGIVPDSDVAALHEAGIAAVLTPGASAESIVDTVRKLVVPRP
jgi:methylmalonyl-CoA mutase cobalamin-binding domain/chain